MYEEVLVCFLYATRTSLYKRGNRNRSETDVFPTHEDQAALFSQETAGSKIGCIHFRDTVDFTTNCILKLELELETRPRTKPNKLHKLIHFVVGTGISL